MKSLLFVTSTLPPAAHSGVHRPTKLLKYLPRFGWRPIVLHVVAQEAKANDPSLLEELPADLVVATIHPGRVLSSLLGTSARITGWPGLGSEHEQYRRARKAGLALAREHDCRAIFVTVPPKRLSSLGVELANASGLPLITDFRDPPWSIEGLWQPRPNQRAFFETEIRRVFQVSERVLPNTEAVRTRIIEGGLAPPERVVTLTNGYDEADFADPNLALPPPKHEAMRIVCPGPLQTCTEVTALARALESVSGSRGDAGTLCLRVLGAMRSGVVDELRASVGSTRLELAGHVSHAETIAEIRASDWNLILQRRRHSALRVPQKLYPCLRAGRPILGLIAPGPARELAERSGLAVTCDPDDASAIAQALTTCLARWEDGQPPGALDEAALKPFERAEIAGRLASMLDEVGA